LAEEMPEKGSGGPTYWQLIVWQKAMAMARSVYALAPRLPREETWGMRSQITRAAVSVATNIAEGWVRESRAEKTQFLSIAQGSLAESETLLTLCEQNGWFSKEDAARTRAMMLEIGRMLTSLRRNLRKEREAR